MKNLFKIFKKKTKNKQVVNKQPKDILKEMNEYLENKAKRQK